MSSAPAKKTITVVIYSYKGKQLKAVVENLIEKSSKLNHLDIKIQDQHGLLRRSLFPTNVDYKHIFWDLQTSPCKYKCNALYSSRSDYFLILSDRVMLPENWDLALIKEVEDKNLVISGKGKTVLEYKNLFFIDKKEERTEENTINQFISRDLMFGSVNVLKSYPYPSYLKYLGEEEVFAATLFCYGVDVMSMHSDFYEVVSEPTLETLYSPFSIQHNYNQAVSLLKGGYNEYIDLRNTKRSVFDFGDFHNISFDLLKPLPFPKNDVDYDPATKYDKLDQRRFMIKSKAII